MTFQSRFGREEWLRPYTDETVLELAQGGVRNWRSSRPALPPTASRRWRRSRSAVRESFLEHGGQNFTHVPCLNATDDHIALLTALAGASSPAGSEDGRCYGSDAGQLVRRKLKASKSS